MNERCSDADLRTCTVQKAILPKGAWASSRVLLEKLQYESLDGEEPRKVGGDQPKQRPSILPACEATRGLKMLRAGHYWIGDPNYILREENGFNWRQVITAHQFFSVDGEYSLVHANGMTIRIGILKTEHGDGRFQGNDGHVYPVDVATIAVVPLYSHPKPLFEGGPPAPDFPTFYGLGKNFRVPGDPERSTLGAVHLFPETFSIYNRGGVLVFGHLEIDTNVGAT